MALVKAYVARKQRPAQYCFIDVPGPAAEFEALWLAVGPDGKPMFADEVPQEPTYIEGYTKGLRNGLFVAMAVCVLFWCPVLFWVVL